MQDTDLVSIITPMYNAGKTIGHTIASVQAQTYRNWEMIIVDDCSTDESAWYVEQCAQKDQRIRLIRQEQNYGIARTRNTAMQHARGRYVAFLDSDDLWLPQKLEKQLAFMKEHDAAFSHTACEIVDTNGQKTGKIRHVPIKVTYEDILKGNVINCLTVVLDVGRVGIPVMPQIHHEDYACWLELLQKEDYAWGLDEILASYRETGASTSGNKFRVAKWQWKIYRNYLKLNLIKSSYCFVHYAWNALKKRI